MVTKTEDLKGIYYLHIYVHTYIYMYTHTYIYMYTHTYIYMYTHTFICTHIHIYYEIPKYFQNLQPRKYLFSWEYINIIYTRINCSGYSCSSNSKSVQTTLMPVSFTEGKVRNGHKTYVSPHTRTARSYQLCSVILHYKLLHSFVVNTLLQTVWFPHNLYCRILMACVRVSS